MSVSLEQFLLRLQFVHVGTNDACLPSDLEKIRPVPLGEYRAHLEEYVTHARAARVSLFLFTPLALVGESETKTIQGQRFTLRNAQTTELYAAVMRLLGELSTLEVKMIDGNRRLTFYGKKFRSNIRAFLLDCELRL